LNIAALIPAIAVVILAPVATWGVTQFVLLPKLQKMITATVGAAAAAPVEGVTSAAAEAAPAKEAAAAPKEGGEAKKGGEGKADSGASTNYTFENMQVNLLGTMGTRFLKTTFVVTGKSKNLESTFTENKAKLTDITLNILSSLTLADMEEPGFRNVLREKLVTAYNQALGKPIAEQIWFSDFVVQ
jgi:flagellar FliL protein